MLPIFRDDPAHPLALAAEAERLGIDGVFVYDHLWPMGSPERPALAPFPVLGAVAAQTSGVWLGTLVARVGVVPDHVLVAQFAALQELAPGRVVAGIGTGDHLSFEENVAYGLPFGPAAERRRSLARCATALRGLGLVVWVGGRSRRTLAVAEATGAVANLWQAAPAEVAAQAARTEVSWGGMARPGDGGAALDAAALSAVAAPLARAGASWVVFGWPVNLEQLAEVGVSLAGGDDRLPGEPE